MNTVSTPVSQDADVPSPCISVCVLDAGGTYCTGCQRTLDEIAGWVDFSPAEKRAVVAALPARRAAGTVK
jgi:uncharacterized protein